MIFKPRVQYTSIEYLKKYNNTLIRYCQQNVALQLNIIENMGSSFKENLRSELDYQDITIKELSSMTGIPYRTIENYLSARASIPPADYAVQIARALKTTVEDLVFGKAKTQTKKSENDAQKTQRLFSKLSKDDQKFFIRLMEGVLKK